jgi:SAM-dependent methyltransferase
MAKRIERPGVRAGYDRWAEAYDRTSNPLVALDRRLTLCALAPAAGERVLDAGCGTGAHLRSIARAGARPVGLDFSRGMLRVARRAAPGVALAQADLDADLPVARGAFDAVLCALVSEHLKTPATFFREAFAALARGGRMVFSAFHPELARSGVEANFEQGGVEFRLGAERHTIDDFLGQAEAAGFRGVRATEHAGDADLVDEVPWAVKYLDRPLLVVIEAERPAEAA